MKVQNNNLNNIVGLLGIGSYEVKSKIKCTRITWAKGCRRRRGQWRRHSSSPSAVSHRESIWLL